MDMPRLDAAALRPPRFAPRWRASPLFWMLAGLQLLLVWGLGAWLAPEAAGRSAVAAALLTFGLAAGLSGLLLRRHYVHERLGLCNAVTQFRAALAAALVVPAAVPGALALDGALAWSVVALAALALALDGVDGWLARRSGLASAFGARFDMEVDALLALILSVLALQNEKAGAFVLVLGLARYVFVAAAWTSPWLDRPLPERFSRKAVCVVQMCTLLALLAPPVVPPWSDGIAGGAILLVLWSFAVDVIWLARRR